jgi:hypothetical protein
MAVHNLGVMTDKQLRAMVLGLPGVEEREAWGRPTFRVRDRIFVGMAPDGTTANVKASQKEQAALIASDPATFGVAAYVGRHGWVEVRLDRVDREEMQELVIEAWRRTAPKRMVAEFDEG